MNRGTTLLFTFLFAFICTTVNCENFPSVHLFLKASKNVPRIGRSMVNNEEFEKFFLKASKSVPRIGRRGEKLTLMENGVPEEQPIEKKSVRASQAMPLWTGIATVYELDSYETPEIALSNDIVDQTGNLNKFLAYE